MKKYIMVAIFFIPMIASASFYPASWQYPGSGDTNYSFGKGGGGEDMMFSHTATTTLASINSFDPYLCRYLGTGAGTAYLSVWYNGTTSPYMEVASSSIDMTTIVPCISNGFENLGSTTPFMLNKVFNATAGDTIYFILLFRGGDSTIYMNSDNTASAIHFPWYSSSSSEKFIYNAKNMDTFAKIGSGLPAYSTSWADLVNEAQGSNPECGITSIGGCISQAFAWAFYPSTDILAEVKDLTLASTTPFSYLYQLSGYMETLKNGTSTASGTALIIPFNGQDITVFNTANIDQYVSSSGMIKTTLGWMIWILVLFVAYKEVQGIFLKPQDDN